MTQAVKSVVRHVRKNDVMKDVARFIGDNGQCHQQSLCQQMQRGEGMSAKKFWEAFSQLKNNNHVKLTPNTKSIYALTGLGKKFCEIV